MNQESNFPSTTSRVSRGRRGVWLSSDGWHLGDTAKLYRIDPLQSDLLRRKMWAAVVYIVPLTPSAEPIEASESLTAR
jgi:hypothetical protein